MDEDRSATTHDPAARLGRATDAPDGIERLGAGGDSGPLATARPAATAWPARWGGEGPGGPGDDPDAGDGDSEGEGDGLAGEHDPPPRWAARPELRITPRSAAPEDDEEEAPAGGAPGRRSTYLAVAVLVAFGAIAAVGLIRGAGTDRAATEDPAAPTTTERREASTGTSGSSAATGDERQGAGATTAPPAPDRRPPAVGECARVDASTPPGEYVQVPCEDPQATVQLTQTVPAPAPPGSHCPAGTDSVTQVSDEPAAGGTGVAQFWCLRNVQPPHPGDPGGGSGELVVGDCLGVAPSSQSIEVPCDGSGLPPEFTVGWMPDAAGNCPAEADATITLQVPFPTKYCLRYV